MNNTNKVERVKDILIIILSIVLLVYIVLGVNSMAHGDKFGFFNFRFYIVSSNVNNGETNSSDLIISTKIKKEKVKENNTIVYKKDNKVYVNQVASEDNNSLYIKSNNDTKENLDDVEVVAKVICTARGIGNIAMFIKSPIGVFNMLMIAICIALIIKKMSNNSNNEIEDLDDNNLENKNNLEIDNNNANTEDMVDKK